MKTPPILSRRVAKILPSADGLAKLVDKQKIRVYLGADPTAKRLHIGHAIGLSKLMEFANAGHEAIFLFGTGTVLVGDPSQRADVRQEISAEEIRQNIENWQKIASKVVDFSKIKLMQNGEWINEMRLSDLVKIGSKVSAIQLFKRESFQRRLKAGDTVWYHETMYPLLQGYDSVKLDVDLEIGGSDQEFNMLMGRELQKKINNKEKYVLTTPMIVGTDGAQMSKSSDNCVWLDDTSGDMYGKLMSLPDEHIDSYLELCTNLSEEEITAAKKAHSKVRDLKARMAYEVTKIYHGEEGAKEAGAAFDSQFKQGETPAQIPEVKLESKEWSAAELLVTARLANSKSEARRLLEQNGVKLNSQTLTDVSVEIKAGDVLQVGKRKYVRIK